MSCNRYEKDTPPVNDDSIERAVEQGLAWWQSERDRLRAVTIAEHDMDVLKVMKSSLDLCEAMCNILEERDNV